MGETSGKPHLGPTRRRRAARFLIGFAISLVVAKAIETFANPEALQAAYRAQREWIDALERTTPFGLAHTYYAELKAAFFVRLVDPNLPSGDTVGGAGLLSPLIALVETVRSAIAVGWLAGLVQLGMGALGVAVLNLRESGGRSIWFGRVADSFLGELYHFVVFVPLLIVITASALSLVLWVLMLSSLGALSWVTGLAASAAGASGVVGFCWYCATKLSERGAERALTPNV